MKKIQIKDIYSGKPDAKDEITFDGIDDFMNSFIVPANCDINSLLKGNHCFISGYKGTGKTALLFYLDLITRQEDENACSSFIFFKEELSDLKSGKGDNFAKRHLSTVSIGKDTLLLNIEFENIWRWLFLKRLVNDNEVFNNGLFLDDKHWDVFKNIVDSIKGPTNPKKSIIPEHLKIKVPFQDSSGNKISPECKVSLSNKNDDGGYEHFKELLNKAEEALKNVTKSDIPYHIFVDELEAYYGDQDIFNRDLFLIRDLIFMVKRFNMIFYKAKMKNIKIICSIRTEILNAIHRFIVTKEINKVTSGFEVPLKWNYNNTNSYAHPIIQILLRRISISEQNDEVTKTNKEFADRWFPEEIHGIDPYNYILNNGWHKPRDIVRLIISAKNSIESDQSTFSQAVFSSMHKQYSLESLNEIKEEMRALYNPEEIEEIIQFFNGFLARFTLKQFHQRLKDYFPDSFINQRYKIVLNDLYRLGFLGNYNQGSNMYRWQHKGDDQLILADEWRLMIHQALQSSLSVGSRLDYSVRSKEDPQIGDVVLFEVMEMNKSFLYGSLSYYERCYKAYIYIGEITDGYIKDINNFCQVGEQFNAVVLSFDEKRNSYSLSKKKFRR